MTVLEMINLLEQMPDDATIVVPGEKGTHFAIVALMYDADLDAVLLMPA